MRFSSLFEFQRLLGCLKRACDRLPNKTTSLPVCQFDSGGHQTDKVLAIHKIHNFCRARSLAQNAMIRFVIFLLNVDFNYTQLYQMQFVKTCLNKKRQSVIVSTFGGCLFSRNTKRCCRERWVLLI